MTRRAFEPAIGGNSLFLAEDADWRWQRRAVAPIFRHETMLSFVPIFATMAERQVERWRVTKPGTPVDAAAAMTRTTFDIIVDAMLGGSASLDAESFSRALTDNFNTIPWQLIYVMFAAAGVDAVSPTAAAPCGRAISCGAIFAASIETRRAKPSAHPDLLDLLLAARDPETGRTMTDAEVVNNLLTFIIAGHETTAVALTWTLWLLAKDQASQQRTLTRRPNCCGRRTDYGRARRVAVLLPPGHPGAMRLFPPAPGHRAAGARRYGSSAACRSAAGARVHIPVFALHRNARLWDNPECFRPGTVHRRTG